LKPAMENFFKLHPSFPIEALTADSWFDAILNYEYLFAERQILPIIKLNPAVPMISASPALTRTVSLLVRKILPCRWSGMVRVRRKIVLNPCVLNSFIPRPRKFAAENIFVLVNRPTQPSVVAGCFILTPKIISGPILPSPEALRNGTCTRTSAISLSK
jgi:hypothetical protein